MSLFIPNLVLGSWYNSSWTYRQPDIIENLAGNQTNYQVKIEINTTALFEAGKLNTTCKDIRFTDLNGNEIDFWIESCVTNDNSTNSTFWGENPTLTNNTNTTIYMYYGNNAVSSASNGTNTFEFFDDFEGASLNTSKWDEGGSGTLTIADSLITLTGDSANGKWIDSDNLWSLNHSLYVKAKAVTVPSYGAVVFGFGADSSWNGRSDTNSMEIYNYKNDGLLTAYQRKDGSTSGIAMDDNEDLNWHTFKIFRVNSSSSKYQVDEGNVKEITTNVPTVSIFATLYARGGLSSSYSTLQANWLFIRKYSSPEPTVSIGSEETESAGEAEAARFDFIETGTTRTVVSFIVVFLALAALFFVAVKFDLMG